MPNVNDETIYQAGSLLVKIVRQAMGLASLGNIKHGEMVSIAIQKHPIVITQQPQIFVGTIGMNAFFHVEAIGEGLTYQWQYSVQGVSWTNSSLSGNDTATLSMELTETRLKYKFRCVITDEDGYSIISDVVRLLTP